MAESSGKRDKSEAPCVGPRPQMSYVGEADLNGLALVNGQLCRSGSPEGVYLHPGYNTMYNSMLIGSIAARVKDRLLPLA